MVSSFDADCEYMKTNDRQGKVRVALMSYAMDNRPAKGTALYTRKLIENLLEDDRFEWYLVHFDRVDDPIYKRAHEIIMPELKLPVATRFVRTMLFFWKYRKNRFDIIHWFQPRLYPFFWLAPATHIVVTAHGAGDITAGGQFPPSRHIFNFILKHCNAAVSAIIADSQFGKEEIVEYYHAARDRVRTIYLGGGESYQMINKDIARAQIKERYGINDEFILDISRHVVHKNIPALIRAYVSLQVEGVQLPTLVIVGNMHQAFGVAQAEVRNSPKPDDIIFINYVAQEDLNALYSAAELFVFPSLNEGFGLPIVEAFASGTPVITSNVTSMPEIAGDAALIVDPTNVSDIAAKIRALLTDETLQKELIEKGLSRAREFSWERTASNTAVLYLDLLTTP